MVTFEGIEIHTLIDPLFDPTIIWSSAWVKVSAVIDETLETLLLSAVMGFMLSMLNHREEVAINHQLRSS